jgi:hypothetical protein
MMADIQLKQLQQVKNMIQNLKGGNYGTVYIWYCN